MTRRFMIGLVCLGLMAGLAGSARADDDLELLGGRFRVTAAWQTPAGASGAAQAIPLTNETGLFWFFSQSNTELVVKILNACTPPFDRFWIYAAGLTNVQVELTVEDTWTGQTKTYQRPAGSLFAPIADTATFDGCGVVTSPCGQGTSEEIAATPRPNAEAEALALLLGPEITADPGIYARLDDDLKRIRALVPSLDDVGFALIWDPSSLIVGLTPDAYATFKAGQFHEWDCLNDWYRGEATQSFDIGKHVLLQLEGFFHPLRIGSDYKALPGVESVSFNGIGYPAGGPLNNFCAKIEGTIYHYFFDDQIQAQRWYIRVPHAGAAPVVVAPAPTGGVQPQPDWWPLYEQCRDDLNEAAQH